MYNIDDIYSYTKVGEKKFTVDFSLQFDGNSIPFIVVSYIDKEGQKVDLLSNPKELERISNDAGYYARKTYSSSYRKGENFIPVYYDPATTKFSSDFVGHSRHEEHDYHNDFPVCYLLDKELIPKLDKETLIHHLSVELGYLFQKNNLDLSKYNIQFSVNNNAILSKSGEEELQVDKRQSVHKTIADFVSTSIKQQYTEENNYQLK